MSCSNYEENSLINNGICIKCYRHRDSHQLGPFYMEKSIRTQIEDTLYYATNECTEKVNFDISRLLHSFPPAQIYYRIFNVYSYVFRNLTNPKLSGMKHEEKLVAIFQGVDFLLMIALPLRRPPNFEKVSKLRRTNLDMQKAEKLDGTVDVISKLGYTVVTRDHFEFPPEIQEAPDQTFIREIIADLMIAMMEIRYYHDNRHPNPDRFSERFELAKRTTPILTDLTNLEDKFPQPPTPLKKEPFIIPDVGRPDPPIDHNLVSHFPSLPFGNRLPPSNSDTIECPHCQAILPKKTTVCGKCRNCIPNIISSEKEYLIPLEKWTCNACTQINSTPRGFNRICSSCELADRMSHVDINPPNPPPPDHSLNYSYKPDRHNSMNPVRNNSVNPRPRNATLNPGKDPSVAFPYDPPPIPNREPIQPMGPLPGYRNDPSVDHSTGPTGFPAHTGGNQDPSFKQPADPVLMRPHPGARFKYPGDNPDPSMYLDRQDINPDVSMYNASTIDPTIAYTPGRAQFEQGLPGYHQEMPFNPYPQPTHQSPHKRIKHILSLNTEFKDEAIQLAIKICGTQNCLGWLKSQFRDNIGILANDVQQFPLCQTVTPHDVEESYLDCQGDMTNVLQKIQKSRATKLDELVGSLKVKEELAIASLDDTNWEISAAVENIVLTCNQQQIDSYRPHLWRDGMTIPEQDKPGEEIDPTLWQELVLFSGEAKEMDNRIVRKFLCEFKVPSFVQLNLLLQLLMSEETKDKDPSELLQAVKEISEFDAAVKFLNQECTVCMEDYTANDMIQMFYCNHSACKTCIIDHFTNVIRGQAIKNWVCFECGEPDITQMDDPSDYFALLSNVVQVMCEPDVSNLFHQKVNEFYFSKRPEFRWCPHCHSGFMGLEGEKKLRCPQEECKQYMCYICKNKWHAEHEGRSCEEFQQWREANDRDILDKGLAARMVEEGIECPSCKFKYELARGGCMHFRCTQCPAEFCSGCFQLFKKDNCTKFPSCAKKGLHAHHPRNCQYFTRDMDIVKMKELIELGGFLSDAANQEAPPPVDGAPANPVKKQQIYKSRVPDEHRNRVIEELTAKMGDAFVEPPRGELKIPCQIVEYKESPGGGIEKEDCSKFSFEKDGCAGLCDKHYKEYVCGLITKAGLDPIDVLQVTDESIFELFAILRRNEIPFDDKMKGDALKQLIKEKLPLQPMNFKGALQA